MVLRPQVGGWVDCYGARKLMLAGAGVLLLTMALLNVAATPFMLIALMAGLGIGLALLSTAGSIVVATRARLTGGARR
jgi:MFS family permease